MPTLSAPILPKIAIVRKTNVVHYLQNRYEVPNGTFFPGRTVRIEADIQTGQVAFYNVKTNELLALHAISYSKGKLVSLPKNIERFKETKQDALKIKVLEGFSQAPEAVNYIAKIAELYPRYVCDQLAIISKCQEEYEASELVVALNYCVEHELFSANDFGDTLEYFRQTDPLPVIKPLQLPIKYSVVKAETRQIGVYTSMINGGNDHET